MSRPKKRRRVCDFPQTRAFAPVNPPEEKATIILTVEEYETIRLIDRESVSQEQCGERMQVAQTTVQQMYTRARKSWRRYWWRACRCGLKAATIASAAEAAQVARAGFAANGCFICYTGTRKENIQ